MTLTRISLAGRSVYMLLAAFVLSTGCQLAPAVKAADSTVLKKKKIIPPTHIAASPPASAAVILNRQQVPILCYHQIRNWRPADSKQARDYIVPEAVFADQLKMLADSGYHTISCDELCNYLVYGAALPAKPIMLTFDDTDLPQYTIAKPLMEKYGFKGMFFIMTVSLGRPHYMSREQVRELSQAGNEIGSHTWDHKNIKHFTAEDWTIQIDKPTQTLEAITGKPVHYFAYPFGLWNDAAIPQLKAHGFKAAFQLSAKRKDEDPLYTIRRIIVPGAWTPGTLQSWIRHSF